jgi:hypothetical protein
MIKDRKKSVGPDDIKMKFSNSRKTYHEISINLFLN